MNLQTIRNRKKAQQSGSMMDALILDKLYGQVESIVKEEFTKNQRELYKKLNADYTESQKRLDQKTKELEKLLENKGEVTQKDISDALLEVQKLKSDMQASQQTIIDQFNAQKDEVVTQAEQKATEILRNVDQKRGPQGIQGKPGKDGSPDTAKQVVEKVNKEGGVKMTAIEGLIDKIEAVKKTARGGGKSGGGMGNPQHEVKSISAGTTSVTTTYPIAANGTAIFSASYQGQILDLNVHYTVAANRKTINFVTAVSDQFANSTSFSITYIRG